MERKCEAWHFGNIQSLQENGRIVDKNVIAFLKSLKQLDCKYKEENVLNADDFNLFEIMKINENENSDILAELLKPDGTHAQGNIFYKGFLNVLQDKGINTKVFDRESIDVKREKEGIDILITSENSKDFAVIIENKRGAPDRIQQIERYFKKMSGYKKKLVVYLTLSGKRPSEKSIHITGDKELNYGGEIVLLSYNEDIVNWLNAMLKEVKAKKVKRAIDQYIEYIKRGAGMIVPKYLEEVLSSDDNFEIARKIVENWKGIMCHLDEEILVTIEKKLENTFQNEWREPERDGDFINISKNNWKSYSFYIGYDSNNGRFYIGVYKKENIEKDNELIKDIKSYFEMKNWETWKEDETDRNDFWAQLDADIKPSRLREISEYYLEEFVDFVNKFKIEVGQLENMR